MTLPGWESSCQWLPLWSPSRINSVTDLALHCIQHYPLRHSWKTSAKDIMGNPDLVNLWKQLFIGSREKNVLNKSWCEEKLRLLTASKEKTVIGYHHICIMKNCVTQYMPSTQISLKQSRLRASMRWWGRCSPKVFKSHHLSNNHDNDSICWTSNQVPSLWMCWNYSEKMRTCY